MTNQAAIQQLIPFSYAKRHGIVIRGTEDNKAVIGFEKMPSTIVCSELQRKLRLPLKLEKLPDGTLNKILGKTNNT